MNFASAGLGLEKAAGAGLGWASTARPFEPAGGGPGRASWGWAGWDSLGARTEWNRQFREWNGIVGFSLLLFIFFFGPGLALVL